MDDGSGYGITEAQAQRLSDGLEKCLTIMDEAIEFANVNLPDAEAQAFKQSIGKVIADLYLNVLDARIYRRYPHLRRQPLPLKDVRPDSEPLAPLDLTQVSLLHLLAEALHQGQSNFIPGLLAYEPINV